MKVAEQEELQSAIKLMLDNPNYNLGDVDIIVLLQGHAQGPLAAFKQWLGERSLLDEIGAYLPQVASDLAAVLAQTRADAQQNLALNARQLTGDLWLQIPGHPDLPATGGRYLRLADNGTGLMDYRAQQLAAFPNALSAITWRVEAGAVILQGSTNSRYQTRQLQSEGQGV